MIILAFPKATYFPTPSKFIIYKMKFIFPFILLSVCLILFTSAHKSHKCTHDKLNVPLRQIPTSSQSLPFGYKQMTSDTFQSIRIHADFSCNLNTINPLKYYSLNSRQSRSSRIY